MSALITSISNGEQSVLGPDYDYASHIPGPSDLGVSSDGTMDATMTNIGAGMKYVDYLITGPNLGNKYFLATGAQCSASDGTKKDRYKYMDNTADQLTQDASSSFAKFGASNLQGIFPGIVAGLADLNPLTMLGALVEDAYPPCQKVQCPTGDVTGAMGQDSQYVRTSEAGFLTSNAGCTLEGFNNKEQKHFGFLLLLFPVAIMLGLHYIKT